MEKVEKGHWIYGGFHLYVDCSGLTKHHECPVPRPVTIRSCNPAPAKVAYKTLVTIAGMEVGRVCSLCFNREVAERNRMGMAEALNDRL